MRDTQDLGRCLVYGVREAAENLIRGRGGFYFHIWEETVFHSNKLFSRSWFYKLTLLDGRIKGIVKGMGSALPCPLYRKGLKRISPWKGEDPLNV